jgi:hypothetical protein
MGDYCTVRFEATTSLAGSVIVSRLVRGARWAEIASAFPMFPVHPAWLLDSRRDFIPHGEMCHVPEGWGEENKNDLEERVWAVQCSVKTTSTVELFCEHILSYLVQEPCLVEYEHEWPHTGVLTQTVEPRRMIAWEDSSSIRGLKADPLTEETPIFWPKAALKDVLNHPSAGRALFQQQYPGEPFHGEE